MKIPVLFYIMLIVECVVAVWVIFRWRQSAIQQRLISLLLIATPLSAIIELWMALHYIRNLWVAHISTLIEYIVILSMCYFWKTKKTEKRMIMIGIVVFIVLWISSKFTFETFYLHDTYTCIIAKTVEIIITALVLFDVLGDPNSIVKIDARVWISSGVIIYSSGTLFLFALQNMMLNTSPELIKSLWPINWILSIVFTLLLARGVWCKATR
jgi:hypothetical protein